MTRAIRPALFAAFAALLLAGCYGPVYTERPSGGYAVPDYGPAYGHGGIYAPDPGYAPVPWWSFGDHAYVHEYERAKPRRDHRGRPHRRPHYETGHRGRPRAHHGNRRAHARPDRRGHDRRRDGTRGRHDPASKATPYDRRKAYRAKAAGERRAGARPERRRKAAEADHRQRRARAPRASERRARERARRDHSEVNRNADMYRRKRRDPDAGN